MLGVGCNVARFWNQRNYTSGTIVALNTGIYQQFCSKKIPLLCMGNIQYSAKKKANTKNGKHCI